VSTIIVEDYDALREAGASEEKARAAAAAVIGTEHRDDLVTKADLTAAINDLKAELIKWNVGAIIAMTAVFATIVKLL
jgi:asparagine synthetase B (glutamine-hydrolysing)